MEDNYKTPLIVDCDPGFDDSVALIILYKNIEKFDLKLICSTAGNTPIEVTTRNCQFFAKEFFPGVRVAKGLAGPLANPEHTTAEIVHGKTGMGNFDPGEQDYPVEEDSAKAMYEVIKESSEPVTLLTLGPLTNVARLLIAYPDAKDNIKEIVAMIGSITGRGNITKKAEFNSYIDPEAFHIVVKSGIKIAFNPIELAEKASFSRKSFLKRKPKSMTEQMILEMAKGVNEILDQNLLFIYDANSIVAMLRPDLYKFTPCTAKVLTDTNNYGQCIMVPDTHGMHCYQEVKNMKKLKEYLLSQLFE